MDSSSPPPRAASSQASALSAGAGEADSALRDKQAAAKLSPLRPASRASAVLPSMFTSFDSSHTATDHDKATHERFEEGSIGKRSPAIDSSLKSPTAHLDTSPSTPIGGGPPYSPQSDDRSSCGSASATAPQQFCLRWNNYQSNLTSVFDQLLQTESLVDVTLACDGRSIKAHKMVLSACSPYFQTLFATTPCQHPIVIMRDVNWFELKSIVDFMYKGEINVSQEQIGPLLRIAEMLKVRGLADVGTTHLSARPEQTGERDTYATQTNMESPKRHETVTSPARNISSSRSHDSDNERSENERDNAAAAAAEAEKKSRLEQSFGADWAISGSGARQTESSSLELRLSPLQQQHLVGRNIRKRRWPSADAIFNPPESPLSSLIAAERAEQERERERDRTREREREKAREATLFTPPIPVSTCSSASVMSTSALEASVHMDITSPCRTPTPNLLPPARTPSGMLTPSPHLQISHHHHHSHQPHQSHRSSPASSVTATHPSSILSRPLTPSPAIVSHTATSSRLESTQLSAESHRFPLGPAQAAAMAAAAQMDMGSATAMAMRPHASAGSTMAAGPSHHASALVEDLEIKPGIAEMIREEERAKMLENSHAWMGGASSSSIADSYQYQLQSMWQKCWNTNQSLMHHLRFRERGPLKSWRPETMAEAIFSVLKEGLSLSQAARKYDIPYPTFVLYANRVHNMLGPSIDGGPDLRPKGRGRPQRILLGIWPDEHIKGVIKTVVFRDAKDLKEEGLGPMPYGRHSPIFPFQEGPLSYPGVAGPCPNGMPSGAGDQMSQEATAAAVAAVAHNIRQQMQMAAAAQQQQQQLGESHGGPNIFNLPPHMASGGPMIGPTGAVGVPLPKASISPALSSSSNTAGISSIMGTRHVPSPCGPTLPGMPQLPPGMAVALHMAGTGPTGRCDPNAVLSQQQQHQLQHLHMQQQHALHQQQQQKHQQQQHQMTFGPHSSALSHAAVMGTPSHSHTHTTIHQTLQKTTTAGSTKPPSSTSSPSRRTSPHSLTPLHSPLTELGLEMSFKPSRPFSPSRLFADDISDIVGVAASPLRSPSISHPQSSTAAVTTATITTTSSINTANVRASSSESSASALAHTATAAAAAGAIDSTPSATSNISSTGIKLEPITTTND